MSLNSLKIDKLILAANNVEAFESYIEECQGQYHSYTVSRIDLADVAEKTYDMFGRFLSLTRNVTRCAESIFTDLPETGNKIIEGTKFIAIIDLPMALKGMVENVRNFRKPTNDEGELLDETDAQRNERVISTSFELASNLNAVVDSTTYIIEAIVTTASLTNKFALTTVVLGHVSSILGILYVANDIRELVRTVKAYNTINTHVDLSPELRAAFKKRVITYGVTVSLSLLSSAVSYAALAVFTFTAVTPLGWGLYATVTVILIVRKGIEWHADSQMNKEFLQAEGFRMRHILRAAA